MIKLPDFSKKFEYENNFYLSCDNVRIARFLAHYELYKMVKDVPGEIVECGVFKGASLVRFAAFRDLLSHAEAKRVIGFDMFGKFPDTNYEEDKAKRQLFIDNAGDESISIEQLETVFEQKKLSNYEFIKGDITKTVPEYVQAHPELKIALLNLDVDIYEPSVTILEHLFPRIANGGVLVLDDYGVFPGETKAVDDYLAANNIQLEQRVFPFSNKPVYIVKK